MSALTMLLPHTEHAIWRRFALTTRTVGLEAALLSSLIDVCIERRIQMEFDHIPTVWAKIESETRDWGYEHPPSYTDWLDIVEEVLSILES